MKRFKLKLGLAISSILASSALIIAFSVASSIHNKQNNSLNYQMSLYHFKTLNKINKKDHLASEFVYANYTVPYSSSQDPNLNDNSQYWENQLELSSSNTKDIINFELKNKNNAPIDLFKEKYNIYYHSFANDKKGILYLKVLLEDKNDDSLKNLSIKEKLDILPQFTYFIEGFKTINSLDKPDNQYQLFNIQATNKLNLDFSNNVINNIDDLINKLPKTKSDNAETIRNNLELISKYLIIPMDNNIVHPFYEIDNTKAIWFTKNSNEELIIHYFLNKNIPVATLNELNKIEKLTIKNEETQVIKLNFSELKEAAKQVKIIPFNNADLSNVIPYENSFTFFNSSSTSDPHHNTSNGYYNRLDLIFDDSYSNSYKYQLEYYLLDPKNGLNKEDNNYTNKPIISYDSKTGSATFAYKIKNKNQSTANGILEYIGTFSLNDAFKKQI
ncbi:MAG1430 family protein [Mycoplasmopsis meleagridis]|uniref:MAG1430 family protein n=1 Tax=Mycoplasmopsis meleagridis TaxID=29561 RepID=UPI003A87154F